LTEATVEDIWKEALAGLTDLLGDNAALAERVTLDGAGRLVAQFGAKYTSCRAFCERPPQRARLEAALEQVAGRPVEIEFRTLEAEPQDEAPRGAAPYRQRMAETAEHPLVRRASELFAARVVRVEEPPTS
jgi:hypothetical protein